MVLGWWVRDVGVTHDMVGGWGRREGIGTGIRIRRTTMACTMELRNKPFHGPEDAGIWGRGGAGTKTANQNDSQ